MVITGYPFVTKREHLRAFRAPHKIRSLIDDRTVVGSGFSLLPTVRRQQLIFPHEPKHPLARHS